MDLNAEKIKNILEENNFPLRKSWGQNFLVDEQALNKIMEAGNLSQKDTVIEVGPGLGTLTLPLSEKTKKVIAVEKDKKIIPLLKNNLQGRKNIEVINKDILLFNIPKGKYKVIANVPYYITSPIIRKFLETKNQPSLLILTIQKEVAERICVSPPKMNLLAVSVQFFAKPKIISHVPPSSFYPSPSVTSSILSIIPYNEKKYYSKEFQRNFFSIVRAGFSHPRKQLAKNLKSCKIPLNAEEMKILGITPERRAETLSVREWTVLTKKLSNKQKNET